MAHMNVAIGVRRAIVEDEALAPDARRAELAIQILSRPFGEDCGLLLREAGFHRKVGLWQEDGGTIIGGFGRV
jgi:hypothetical protein